MCLFLALVILSATGGSAMKAIEVLMEHGVQEEKILFLNLVGSRVACRRPSPS
jgi:uracil phosphoribosyltransferase